MEFIFFIGVIIALVCYISAVGNKKVANIHERDQKLKAAGIGPKCPVCEGSSSPLVGQRGKQLASSGMGALLKQRKCDVCGYTF